MCLNLVVVAIFESVLSGKSDFLKKINKVSLPFAFIYFELIILMQLRISLSYKPIVSSISLIIHLNIFLCFFKNV